MTGNSNAARAAGIELETVSATLSGNRGDYFYYEGADGVMVEEYLTARMGAVTREVVKDSFISVFCQPARAIRNTKLRDNTHQQRQLFNRKLDALC